MSSRDISNSFSIDTGNASVKQLLINGNSQEYIYASSPHVANITNYGNSIKFSSSIDTGFTRPNKCRELNSFMHESQNRKILFR